MEAEDILSRAEILEVFRDEASVNCGDTPPQEIETDFLYRGLRTALAMHTLSIAMQGPKTGGHLREVRNLQFLSDGSFADESGLNPLSVSDLTHHLEHASGLPLDACASAIRGLRAKASGLLSSHSSIELFGLGMLRKTDNGSVTLALHDGLAVIPSSAKSAAASMTV